MMQLPTHYRRGQALGTLVENRTVYTMQTAEMNIFETHAFAEGVVLHFDQPTLASMVMGKKVMHLRGHDPFAFLPGESVMLPASEVMRIDFPEATLTSPTKCLALVVDEAKIANVTQYLNEERPKADDRIWSGSNANFRFSNDPAIHQIIQRLIFLFSEDHPAKEFFVENMLNELLIRLMETESRQTLLATDAAPDEDDRIRHIIRYIREHLSHKLDIKSLSRKACMSESHFHHVFKNELGYSPVEFIIEERLSLAAHLLLTTTQQISEVSMACGFNNLSYFNRAFKKRYGVSPSGYQKKV